MDIATLVGLIGAVITVGATIMLGGSASTFFNVPSLVIVLVGTLLVTMMKFSLSQFLSAAKVAIHAFTNRLAEPTDLIDKSVELAKAARQSGILALEEAEVPDPFMKKGINLLIDGHDAEVVRKMLSDDVRLTLQRHSNGQAIFKAIGDVGPAMGMIGTLIGLVQMLSAMDDPKSIGPAMAVALLTTLYGAILANVIAIPIADKLKLRSADEKLCKSMVIDALMGIQEGQNPRVIEGLLQNYLPTSSRPSGEEEAA
ncbi:MAG: flagellar motor protein PomA [Gammaproteobacteria bacterium]